MKKKWIVSAVVGFMLSFCVSMTGYAAGGEWKSNALGWWYQYEDGSFPRNSWMEINGYRYFFNREGYMVTGWNKIGGYQYCLSPTGEQAQGWCYNDFNEKWYYYNEDGNFQRDWLYDKGNWYWFSYYGEMAESEYKNVNSARYYFFDDGRMAANQYVGLSYVDENGIPDSRYDIVLEGKEKTITGAERDRITYALKDIPRGWIKYFNEKGWKILYYTDKSYFSAPDTDEGVYYVHHKLDTSYKKLKFTDPDSLTKVFGEYIGYAAGCYEENNQYGKELVKEQFLLQDYVNVPSYFDSDLKFYFGCLTQVYFGWDTKEGVKLASDKTYSIMSEIMNLKEDESGD